jgi:hypothetical protein
VGDGNNDVGRKSPTHNPGQPKISGVRTGGAKVSGAMSQQRGDSGNESAPQKFVQLVGCREPKVRPGPWVRPRAPQG